MSIREYWIDEIQKIKEFDAIATTEDVEVESLNNKLQQLIDDQFIETAQETGIARREKMLKLVPFADDTLESRRFRVNSKWGDSLPYTYNSLNERLTHLCGENGYTINLNHNEYSLLVRVELTVKRMEEEARNLVRKMAPANLLVTVELRYNQHMTLVRYTHEQLKTMAHQTIREEVLQ